jgi:hypothetical protein
MAIGQASDRSDELRAIKPPVGDWVGQLRSFHSSPTLRDCRKVKLAL